MENLKATVTLSFKDGPGRKGNSKITKDTLKEKAMTTHQQGAQPSTTFNDNDSEGEIDIVAIPSAGVAGARAGKATETGSDADDESETKGKKKQAKQPLASKTNSSKLRFPTEPFSGLSISDTPEPESPGKKNTKQHIKVHPPYRANTKFPKTPQSLGKIPSDDDVSPKTKSNKPISQPTPQQCLRCGEIGWNDGYCPKCGSGNAYGTLG